MGFECCQRRRLSGLGGVVFALLLYAPAFATINDEQLLALSESARTQHQVVQDLITRERVSDAADEAERFYVAARVELPEGHALLPRVRTFVADTHLLAGNLTSALRHYTNVVAGYSEYSFDVELVEPLHGLAQTYIGLGLDEDAEQALLRAQNLSHRDDGVYTLEQVEILEDITDLKQDISVVRRDQQRRYHLRIHEDAFGKDDPKLVPSMLRLARYLDERAVDVQSHLLTREYRRRVYRTECYGLYERAIGLIKDAYGESDPRLIEPMLEYAEVLHRHQSSRHRANKLVRDIEKIVTAQPGATQVERAEARVAVADYYNMWNDGRASRLYREAWDMLADDPAFEIARNELFDTPVRLTETALGERQYPVRARPLLAETNEDLYSEVSYTVTADGKVRNVETIGGNVPTRKAVPLRLKMARIKYRPRFVDGEPVSTEGVVHVQPYKVNRYAKKRPIDHIKCTSCTQF